MIATLAEVRDQLGLEEQKIDEDATITRLIESQQAWLESLMGARLFEPADFSIYLGGDGTDTLSLGQGPVQTFTSLSYVTYGGAQPAEEIVDPTTYMVDGLVADAKKLPARVVSVAGVGWLPGVRNYKAVFNAGWGFADPAEGQTVGRWLGPPELKQLVIDLVVWRRNRRKDVGLGAREIGVPGGMQFRTDSDMLDYVKQIIGPYCDAWTVG